MSLSTIRIVIAFVFIFHGIGHLLAVFPLFGIKLSEVHSSDSWLLNSLLGGSVSNALSVVVWMAALLAFAGSGAGLMGWVVPTTSWVTLAIIGAVFSLVGLILFWNGFPFLFPNKIGVIGINLATLYCLLILHWPAELMVK